MLSAIYGVAQQLAPWLLLGALLAGVVHVALPPNFIQRTMTGRGGVLRAVLLGVPLPLCSCGVIPAAIGLKKDGASQGSAVGFLIATPQTGVDSVLVSGALLGWPFALFKVLSALCMGWLGGVLVDRTSQETVAAANAGSPERPRPAGLAAVLHELFRHSLDVIRMIWGWLVVGIVVSAALGLWLPKLELGQAGQGPLLPLVLALLISLPLYVCATASVPIAAALVAGGLPLGAALVFLVAGPATNLATIGAVHRAFGRRALSIYLATLIVGSIGFGLAFDFLLEGSIAAHAVVHHESSWLGQASAWLLGALLAWFAVEDLGLRLRSSRASAGEEVAPSQALEVSGMTCQGCARRLQARLSEVEGVCAAQVDFEQQRAVVSGNVSRTELCEVVRQAGFEAH